MTTPRTTPTINIEMKSFPPPLLPNSSSSLNNILLNIQKLFFQLLEISKAKNKGVAGKEFFNLLNMLFDYPEGATKTISTSLGKIDSTYRDAAVALAHNYEAGKELETKTASPSPSHTKDSSETNPPLENKKTLIAPVDTFLDELFYDSAETYLKVTTPHQDEDKAPDEFFIPIYRNCTVWFACKYFKRTNPAITSSYPDLEPLIVRLDDDFYSSVYRPTLHLEDYFGMFDCHIPHTYVFKSLSETKRSWLSSQITAINVPPLAPYTTTSPSTAISPELSTRIEQSLHALRELRSQLHKPGSPQMGKLVEEVINIINTRYSDSTGKPEKIQKGIKIAESVISSISDCRKKPSSTTMMYHVLKLAWLKDGNAVRNTLNMVTGTRSPLKSHSEDITTLKERIQSIDNYHPQRRLR